MHHENKNYSQLLLINDSEEIELQQSKNSIFPKKGSVFWGLLPRKDTLND